jgi:hypothetical protein
MARRITTPTIIPAIAAADKVFEEEVPLVVVVVGPIVIVVLVVEYQVDTIEIA